MKAASTAMLAITVGRIRVRLLYKGECSLVTMFLFSTSVDGVSAKTPDRQKNLFINYEH
jgi:hypothetical protein